MIIDCINCTKKFEVNASLIPDNGRTIQCGSCNHIWFYKPKIELSKNEIKTEISNPKSNDNDLETIKMITLMKDYQKQMRLIILKTLLTRNPLLTN
jgi:predicted Zn finger-like uncharacterized protein